MRAYAFSRGSLRSPLEMESQLICPEGGGGVNRPRDWPILKIFLPGFRIQRDISTDLRIRELTTPENTITYHNALCL